MKKRRYAWLVIILVVLWIFFVLAGLVLSHSMQDKIIQILTEQADKYIQTEIHIRKSDIHFSVLKKFPDASVELRNIYVKIPPVVNLADVKPVKGDTLLYAKSLYLQLNLLSLLGNRYELQKISIEDGFVQLVTDNQGHSSMEIMRKTSEKETSDFTADINTFAASKLTIYTNDSKKKSKATVYIHQAIASGSFSGSNFAVSLKSSGTIRNFEANRQRLEPFQDFTVELEVTNSKSNYTVKKGLFNLSNIPFKVVGNVRAGENLLVDLLFSAQNVSLKKIDKALLKGLLGNTGVELRGGNLDIQSTIIGNTRYSLPSIKAIYKITDGKFYDARHDVLVENVFLKGNADNGQEHLPKTFTIRIDTFNFKVGASTQSGRIKIQNLIEPKIAIYLNGHFFLKDIRRFLNVPAIKLTGGEFYNKLAFAAQIIKQEDASKGFLKDVNALGTLDIRNLELEFEKYNVPRTNINGNVRLVNNTTLSFSNLHCASVRTDITINGVLSNFYARPSVPSFDGTIRSEKFFADDFINNSSSSDPIAFPDSIDINGTIEVASFYFGKFESQDAKGRIEYYNKFLKVNNYSMNGFEGSINGKLTLQQNKTGNIDLFTDANLEHVNIKKLFYACDNFNQDVIGSQHLDGSLSGHVIFNTSWTNTLEFIPSSVAAQSEFTILNGEIKDYEPLLGLSDYINVEELKDIKFDKLSTTITIYNQKALLDQTHIASSAITFDGSGMHDFDNTYEYRLQLGLSDLLWKKAKKKGTENTEFGYVVDDGVGHTILPLVISGQGTEFEVKYDKKTARSRFKDKMEAEKSELRELLKGEENSFSTNEASKENTPTDEQKPLLQKVDSTKYRTISKDFIIEWDDN